MNLAQYSNPELDRLLEDARSTGDREQRTADYCAISRLINHEATWVWLFQSTYYALANKRVHNVPTMFSGVIDVAGVWLE